MNRTGRRYSKLGYSKCCSIAVLVSAFLMWSEIPLWASPSQSSQSDTASQNPGNPLPDAPRPQSTQTPPSQQPAPAPSGAAGAKAANVKGTPAAQPTGAAVAPVRQRGHHSLLIKVGLVAGAAIAVGSVVALSQGRSQARPPGASESIRP